MNKENSNDEIDIFKMIHYLVTKKYIIIKSTFISFILGLVLAIFSTIEFQAKSVFIAQSDGNQFNLGNLSSLASMAGVSLGNGANSELLPIILYPEISSSAKFQKDLMNSVIYYNSDSITIVEYYKLDNKDSALGKILKYPFTIFAKEKQIPETSREFLKLTKQEVEISKWLQTQIELNVDEQTGCITVLSNFKEAKVAAQIGQNYIDLLQSYITAIKIKKASQQYEFVKNRFEEQQHLLYLKQLEIAKFKDSNKNFTSSTSQILLQRLNADYNILTNVYTELAKQVESSKLQVKKNTPVFMMIDPITIPTNKSKPNRLLILLISLFAGFLGSISFILCYYLVKTNYIKTI